MNPFEDKIISQLRATEFIKASAEVAYKKETGKKGCGIVAVVTNRPKDSVEEEACVFLFNKSDDLINIIGTYPIYMDFELTIDDISQNDSDEENNEEMDSPGCFVFMKSGSKQLILTTNCSEAIQNVQDEINKHLDSAKKHSWQNNGASHQWVEFYNTQDSGEVVSSESKRSSLVGLNMSEDNPFIAQLSSSTELENSDSISNSIHIKEEYITKKMQERETEFTLEDNIKVFVGTWNVNGRPSRETLVPWFKSSKEMVDADIIAVGFQELDLSPEAFLLSDSTKEDEWTRSIEKVLVLMDDQYTKVKSKQLVGMLLMVYVKQKHVKDIDYVEGDSAGCGIMGMGNKGAVAIRVKFRDTYLCFVNCHLAAYANQVSRRNQDYQEICRRITFPSQVGASRYFSTVPGIAGAVGLSNYNNRLHSQGLSVFNNDNLFWFGDLNYRVALPEEKVFALLQENQLNVLIQHDQLNEQKRKGLAFGNFEEGELRFVPTYKYEIGSEILTANEKKRVPSWCDRILWCSNKRENISQLFYQSQNSMVSSDHKPVSALFHVKVKTLLKEKYEEVWAEISRDLDKFENELTAVISVSPLSIDLGKVKYNVPVSKTITVVNTSPTLTRMEFLPHGDTENLSEPWLLVSPAKNILLPGESKDINVKVLVNNTSASGLNTGQRELRDILNLALPNGKAYFIEIFGEYLPSCFGTPLDYLSKLKGPIRQADPKEILALPSHFQRSVPWEIWRMGDFLSNYGAGVSQLFLKAGDEYLVSYIVECLDTGEEFDLKMLLDDPSDSDALSTENLPDSLASTSHIGIHSMAEALLQFLMALPDPVVSFDLYDRCIAAFAKGKKGVTDVRVPM
ncbi:hypothetical protein K7432_008278 [Basidiobolus ranarum]|uniref:Rho-GAP domain-containing protein n=1 Tax=Basidiobolus ranarum TaxID=34480 RepID=A0ABR2VZ23_9FUNG